MLRLVLLIGLSVAMVTSSFGATCPDVNKHPGIRALRVSASIKAEDSTSAGFVFELRESIRKSVSYCLVEADKDARFTVSVNGWTLKTAI
jgi:hypothetical protein